MQKPNDLPLYLRANFVFFQGTVLGKAIIWAKVTDNQNFTPDGLVKQKSRLEEYFKAVVVFVFDRLASWERKRLIEKQIGFVQTGQQLYIPELVLQLSDVRQPHHFLAEKRDRLSYPAQAALLCHLQRTSLNGKTTQEFATVVNYSAMTITRIIREWQQLELITVHSGKERTFAFHKSGKELWLQALHFLHSPVKEEWYSYGPLALPGMKESSETALASYTMLAEGRLTQFALGKEQFRSLKTLNRLPELNKNQGNSRLEVWHYDPAIVAGAEPLQVDKLSLYLSLATSTDERVKNELEKMINKLVWLKD